MPKLSDLVSKIILISEDDTEISVTPEDTIPDVFYPDNKFSIDLSLYLPPAFHLASVVFVVHSRQNHTLKISVVGKERVVARPLAHNNMFFSGDKIELDMMDGRERQALYILDIRYYAYTYSYEPFIAF